MWPVSIIQFGEEQMAGLEYFQLGMTPASRIEIAISSR